MHFLLGCVDILVLLLRETLNQWKSCQKPSFFLKTRFLLSVSEPPYVFLLSGYDEMSTEPSTQSDKFWNYYICYRLLSINIHKHNLPDRVLVLSQKDYGCEL